MLKNVRIREVTIKKPVFPSIYPKNTRGVDLSIIFILYYRYVVHISTTKTIHFYHFNFNSEITVKGQAKFKNN
jgi:hypothetical protein